MKKTADKERCRIRDSEVLDAHLSGTNPAPLLLTERRCRICFVLLNCCQLLWLLVFRMIRTAASSTIAHTAVHIRIPEL